MKKECSLCLKLGGHYPDCRMYEVPFVINREGYAKCPVCDTYRNLIDAPICSVCADFKITNCFECGQKIIKKNGAHKFCEDCQKEKNHSQISKSPKKDSKIWKQNLKTFIKE